LTGKSFQQTLSARNLSTSQRWAVSIVQLTGEVAQNWLLLFFIGFETIMIEPF